MVTDPEPNPLAVRRAGLALAATILFATTVAPAVLIPRGKPRPLPDLRVDVNSAPAAVLEALPRLGPVLAGRIVEVRAEAPITELGDLDRRVRGIGPVVARTIAPHLRFVPETGRGRRDAIEPSR